MSTLERAYFLARSGEVADLPELKQRLKGEGFRAVDALLATYSVRRHLQAICAATFRSAEANSETPSEPEAAPAAQHDESST